MICGFLARFLFAAGVLAFWSAPRLSRLGRPALTCARELGRDQVQAVSCARLPFFERRVGEVRVASFVQARSVALLCTSRCERTPEPTDPDSLLWSAVGPSFWGSVHNSRAEKLTAELHKTVDR